MSCKFEIQLPLNNNDNKKLNIQKDYKNLNRIQSAMKRKSNPLINPLLERNENTPTETNQSKMKTELVSKI